MSSRRALLILSVVATAAVAGGAASYFRPGTGQAPVAQTGSDASLPLAGGPSLLGLRLRASEAASSQVADDPAPAEAAAEAAPSGEAASDATASIAPPAASPLFDVEAPLPPRRPTDLAATQDYPLPPRRPADLLAGVEPPPPQAGEAASESPVAAPLPPPRPHEPALGEAPAPAAAPAMEGPVDTLVAAPLPPPRPRDLVVAAAPENAPAPAQPGPAQPAPTPAASSSASEEIAAHTAAPSLRAEPDASAEKPGQPPRFVAGAPAYVRIFKKESELELWLRVNGRYALYRTFPICKWSGRLGPKVREADYQSPEGFYSVSAKQLNPRSNYHLAFNVGYPNAYDKQNGRTGGLVMVHGDCKSVGCFAMTDQGVDEIYRFVAAALNNGQREVPVHIFPFRMTEAAIARETAVGGFMSFLATESSSQQWEGFWRNLKEGYDLFESTGEPPTAFACGDHYAFGAKGGACARIAGW